MSVRRFSELMRLAKLGIAVPLVVELDGGVEVTLDRENGDALSLVYQVHAKKHAARAALVIENCPPA
jgi:hypothetical protein